MIILLFVLAGLMVLCGSAAALLGWDVVLNERGWTQVIAGASFVTGGLLLFGIAVAARELQRLRCELVAAVAIPEDEELAAEAQAAAPEPAEGAPAAPAPEPAAEPPRLEAVEIVRSPEPPGPQPDLRDALTRKLDEDLARLARSRDIPAREPPAQLAERETEEPARPPAPEEAPAPVAPTVIGTYASGGITYFMFSDNSIEADMDGGRYRFHSMEELRRYLESGEGGTLLATLDERTPVAS
jgi:hypothetical protein